MKPDPRFLSYYYDSIQEMPEITLDRSRTALLLIDMQKNFISRTEGESVAFKAAGVWEHWLPFHDRLDTITVPACKKLLEYSRNNHMCVTFAKIASLVSDGSDRSPVQKKAGWNDILLPVNDPLTQMIDELSPIKDEIVVNKTTDSVVAGTNYDFLMRNKAIKTIIVGGIVTDQCVASSIRGLADAGYQIICVEDACAAGCMEQHIAELKIMNFLYCTVLSLTETLNILEINQQPRQQRDM